MLYAFSFAYIPQITYVNSFLSASVSEAIAYIFNRVRFLVTFHISYQSSNLLIFLKILLIFRFILCVVNFCRFWKRNNIINPLYWFVMAFAAITKGPQNERFNQQKFISS